jgi:uncharacterized short protein YbdD (DUF466 family)
MTSRLKNFSKQLWRGVRELSGDDAYERYLRHHVAHHADDGEPLSKKAFFRQWQDEKWRGVKRCC